MIIKKIKSKKNMTFLLCLAMCFFVVGCSKTTEEDTQSIYLSVAPSAQQNIIQQENAPTSSAAESDNSFSSQNQTDKKDQLTAIEIPQNTIAKQEESEKKKNEKNSLFAQEEINDTIFSFDLKK